VPLLRSTALLLFPRRASVRWFFCRAVISDDCELDELASIDANVKQSISQQQQSTKNASHDDGALIIIASS